MITTTPTDPVTRNYLDRCLSPGNGLLTAMDDARLPPALFEAAGQRLLSRPLLVPQAEMRAFAQDVVALFRLISDLPWRLFDGDLDRYCAQVRIDRQRAALMCRLGGGRAPMYGRADMYHDGQRFRLLEFNIASELGGVDRAGRIPAALLEVEAFAEFARDHRLGFTDTGRRVADTLDTAGRAITGGLDPRVALVDAPGGMAAHGSYWRSFQELMCRLGLDFRIGEIGDLIEREGKLHLDGAPIDVILRTFSVEEICAHPDGPALVEPVLRAHESGGVVLWTPMASSLYGNKAALALLSDSRWHHRFTAEELALIDRTLPWTRSLGAPGPPALGAPTTGRHPEPTIGPDASELMRVCRDRQHELILKPNAQYGGTGIVVGWQVDARTWRQELEDGASSGCVVQQRVRPRPEPVVDPTTGRAEDWWASWGMFVTPDGYAGSYARVLPAGSAAVIGLGADARTRTAGVFVTGDREPA